MRHNAVLAASLLLLPASGCATATIEDAVPAAALESPAAEQPESPAAEASETPAVQTPGTPVGQAAFSTPGDYPNLNVVPAPAAAQLTDEELRQEADALRARRDQLSGTRSGGVRDSSGELRRLGRRHAEDTLREIEGE